FNEANSTFPVSEADFILHEWLTSYCNSMVDQEKKKLMKQRQRGIHCYQKKNIKPPIRKCNDTTNNVNTKSILDQSDTDETDNLQDSLDVDQEKNKITKAKAKKLTFDQDNIYKAAHNSDTLTTVIDVDNNSSQDESLTLTKNRSRKNIQPLIRLRNTKIKVIYDQDITNKNDIIPSDNVSLSLKNILRSSRKHNNIKNAEHNEQNSGVLDEIDGKRKRVQKAKESSLHKARVTKKTKK
ncbi:5633_t:CDS:2, partial [Gigaspora rosea]